MINKDLRALAGDKIAFSLTPEQDCMLLSFADFMEGRDSKSVFLLKGYAGTGKTTLVGAIIRSLQECRQKVVLMAPTGRAAKVFSKAAGCNAYTIHRKIYRQQVFDGDWGLSHLTTIYIKIPCFL